MIMSIQDISLEARQKSQKNKCMLALQMEFCIK